MERLHLTISLYLLSFAAVWVGAGLVVNSVSTLARSWKLPTFVLSFFVLGLLTSLPEATIGAIAVFNNDPVIYAGNLLGGVIVMLLGIIPLLGMVGNGIRIPKTLTTQQMILTLIVILAPSLLTADQKIHPWEGILLILLYSLLLLFMSTKQSFLEKLASSYNKKSSQLSLQLGKICLGIGILILGSNQIVNSTLYFADYLKISPFFVSLVIVALGTNIPEISIVFRSVMEKKKDIALANYLGSASSNTLLFGLLTIIHGKPITLPNHFLQRFIFLAVGIVLFYFFSKSRNTMSRKESLILFSCYALFVIFELIIVAPQ